MKYGDANGETEPRKRPGEGRRGRKNPIFVKILGRRHKLEAFESNIKQNAKTIWALARPTGAIESIGGAAHGHLPGSSGK